MLRHALALAVLALAACDSKPKAEPAPVASETPEPPAKPPEPTGPPLLSIDASGALIGFERVLLKSNDAPDKLKTELEKHRRFFEGQEAKLSVDRRVMPAEVALMLDALGAVAVGRVLVRTSTRAEYPNEVGFVPLAKAKSAPPCSIVAMILEDRGTAVWKLSGGPAGKRGKGMAGPDLTLTAETIAQRAKGCEQSSVGFVAGAEGVDFGLVYDLAASTRKLSTAPFAEIALLPKPPVPGHAVEL